MNTQFNKTLNHNNYLPLSGAILKLIAVLSMFCDHFGAIVMPVITMQYDGTDNFILYSEQTFYMRIFGRIAFVIYAFLLTQGFIYTKSHRNFIIRLLCFALLSEVFFDIAFNNTILEFGAQNIFFTLLLGYLALYFIEKYKGNFFIRLLCVLIIVLSANFINSDYATYGVIIIILFYILRHNKKTMLLCVAFWLIFGKISEYFIINLKLGENFINAFSYAIQSSILQAFSVFGLVLIYFYNGKKGKALPKYLMYTFYPAHLFLLFSIAYFIGR